MTEQSRTLGSLQFTTPSAHPLPGSLRTHSCIFRSSLWAYAAFSGTAILEQVQQLISYEKESEKFKGDNLFLKLQVSLVPDNFYYPKRKI